MAKIIIENLKNITHLEFDIPAAGVHVLTGVNGSGKTTLLACLQRITDKNAFKKHFRSSSNTQFDSFRNSKIRYEHQGIPVEYVLKRTKWSPTPRANSSLLSAMGYNSAIHISSSIERFYVQSSELNTKGIQAASPFVRDSMNAIFQTTKYSELRRKKLDGRGRGFGRSDYGFLMPAKSIGGQNQYFTEKNFSLGELLIINALFQLERISNNSLVLIDEIELALHPKVQVKFLNFLQRIAAQKSLTIILSTHSSSLIKTAPNLIYLERNAVNGKVTFEYDCYPAVALQAMAIQEEVQPDIVFYVEDTHARNILEELLNYYFRNLFTGRKPIYKVLPVGGWGETIRFTVASIDYLIPQQTKVIAMLDADVLPEIQAIQQNPNRSTQEQEKLNTYTANVARIRFLPITPELGIVDLLNNNPQLHFQPLQNHFNSLFYIAQIIQDEINRPGITYPANPRKAAKLKLDYYINRLKGYTNRDYNYLAMKLAEYYALQYCPNNLGALQALFNPIMN